MMEIICFSFEYRITYHTALSLTSHVQGANVASSFYAENDTYGLNKVSDGESYFGVNQTVKTVWECTNGKYSDAGLIASSSSAAKTWTVYD